MKEYIKPEARVYATHTSKMIAQSVTTTNLDGLTVCGSDENEEDIVVGVREQNSSWADW